MDAETWTNGFRQEASRALTEAEASLQGEVMDAVLEAQSCRDELAAVGATMNCELEQAREELRQAEAQTAVS